MGEFFLGVHLGRLTLDLLILDTGFACQVAIRAKTPGINTGELVIRLVVEVDVIDLLDGAAGEARVMLDEIFEIGAGGNLSVAMDGLVPGEVTASEHGVHTGESTHIATHNAATGKEERGQGDDVPIPRGLAVGRITPQRVVVTDPVRIVPNIVAGGFVAPRLKGVLDALTNTLAERIERLVSDADKLPTDRLWHAPSLHSHALSPVTQGLTVDFACRRLGQLREKLDLPWVFMLTELRLHKCLDVRFRVRGGSRGDDIGLDDLAAQGVRHPDHCCFHDQGMCEQRLLDLHGAHRPASRNDDIVRTAFVVEIALGVAVPPVFDGEPLALALHRNAAALVGWQDPASAVDNGDVPAGGGFAEGSRFDGVSLQT